MPQDAPFRFPGAIRQPARTSISAALPARSRRARSRRATRSSSAKSGKRLARQAHRRAGRRSRARGRRAGGHHRAGGRGRGVARQHAGGARRAAAASPTSSRPTSSGSTSTPLLPGRSYILRTETDQASATVTELKHRIDVNNFAQRPPRQLEHERGRRLQHLDPGCRSPSTASPRTAPPAPSS